MSNRLIPDERIRDDIAACADLLKLEFAGNDPTQLYQLAFSRLTKPNLFRQLGGNRHAALRAPFLKGTDQRDQFVPHLARVLATQDMMSVLDIGCGDGTSTGFLLEACPGLADRITHITYSDVSDPYLDSYEEAVVSRYAIASSDRLKMPFDRLDSVAAGRQHTVCLILHSLYFLSDPGTLRAKLAGWLAPGALVLVVVADERGDFGEYVPFNTWLPRPVVGTQGLSPVGWHRVVEQWGAAQLQSRFQDLASRWMTSTDYASWAAVRSIAEGVTRTGSNDATKLRNYIRSDQFQLAGFKGRKLSYRSWNGQLRQPIALIHPRALVSQSPQQGFLHPVNELDTLGFDKPEVHCENLAER